MALVYRHRRVDNNEVFYIGIGNTKKRAYTKVGRNNLWQKVYNKTAYIVEIIAEKLTVCEAKELECLLIKEYGRKNINTGTLCNLTDGGEGSVGYVTSEETKIKQRLKKIGIKGKPCSEKQKLQISFANKGSKNKMFGMKGSKHPNSKIVLDVSNGIFYESLTEACISKSLDYKTASYFLTKAKINKTTLIYV